MSETKQVNGVIESINYSAIFQGNYGDTAMCFVKINGEDYSCNVKPYQGVAKLQFKTGDNYIDAKVGMQVVFEASVTVKGEKVYNNFKSSKVVVLNSGGVGTSQPPQSTNTPQPTHSPTPQEKVANIADMDAIVRSNCLVAAMIKAYGSLLPEKFKSLELDMFFRAADGYVDYCKNGRK